MTAPRTFRAPASARCYFLITLQIAPGGSKSSPKWPLHRAHNAPRDLQKSRKTAPNEQQNLSCFQECFPAFSSPKRGPQGHPKWLLTRPSRPGPHKGCQRAAQGSPMSSQGAILSRCSAHFRTMLGPSEAHLGFMWGPRVSSSSVWVVVSCGSSFVALFRTSPRCHYASKPPNHHTSKPQRLQERGPAAWGRSP